MSEAGQDADGPAGGPPPARYGETWVFESIVGAVPGIDLSDRGALAVQLFLFAGLAAVVAGVYDVWAAFLPATAAIVVATAGSAVMLGVGRRVRGSDLPAAYRQLLFAANLEVVLGVVGYAAILTVVFVYQPRHGGTILAALLGEPIPLPAAFLFFVILWDVAYRIGTGWWIAMLSLWRSLRLPVDSTHAPDLRAIDRLTAAFALIQLALVPVVWGFPVLTAALLGHVAAVFLVVGIARTRTARSG